MPGLSHRQPCPLSDAHGPNRPGLFVLMPFVQRYVEPPLNGFFGRVPGLGWLHVEAVIRNVGSPED